MFRIMIADDNPNIIEELKEIVDWEDFSAEIVYTCGNGEVLYKEIQKNPPDIVLSDIAMPCMGGLDLSKRLRETHPQIKVILISCFSDFEYAQKGIELGVCGYIVKPIQKDNLIETMNRVVAKITEERFSRAALGNRDKVLEIAQQNIWIQLLLSGEDHEQIKEKLSILHIEAPQNPRICVACIRLLEDYSREETITRIQKVRSLVEQTFANRNDIWAVRLDEQNLMLVQIIDSEEIDELDKLLVQLCIDAESQMKQKIKIGVSNFSDRYNELPCLKEQAFFASRRRYGQLQTITPFGEISSLMDDEECLDQHKNPGVVFYSEQNKPSSKTVNRNKNTEKAIKAYVEMHYMEAITTAQVAKAVFLSPSYANTIFRKTCGMTIFDYILLCRINQAKKLLIETTTTVEQIAEQVGYNSKANFYLAFKRMTEMSPTEYRNRRWQIGGGIDADF